MSARHCAPVIFATAAPLFDGKRVGGRPDRAGNRDRRRDEQEFVNFVGGAVLGELLHVEDLAHGHSHHRDRDPVPGLVDAGLGLVGPHLAAPGVACEGRKLGALDPFQRLEGEPRRVPSRIAVPAARFQLRFHLPGAHDDEIAALHLHVLRFGRAVEVGAGDGVAVLEDLPAERARHVEKHAAADHPVLGLLDAALLGAVGGDFAAIVSVPHGVFVEHVAEPVPLRAALERHDHHVVGRADAAVIEHARIRVGARAQHRVHGVDAPHRRVFALCALRPGVVEVERERDHLALLHQPRRGDDVLGLRVVEGPDLVLGAPLAPVLVFLCGVAKVLSGELAAWHRAPFCVVEETGKKRRGATLSHRRFPVEGAIRLAARCDDKIAGPSEEAIMGIVVRVVALCIASVPAGVCQAQDWPSKPIRLVVPFAPAGPADITARLLAQKLNEYLGQQVLVDNRAGAGGNIGAAAVAKSTPDGYTALLTTSAFAVNVSLFPNAGYDAERDLIPTAVVVAKPNMTPIHFRGAGPAVVAVVAGEPPVGSMAISGPLAQVKAGKLRVLAVSSAKRIAALPDVPTFAEAGFPGIEDYTWIGVFLPAGTPSPIVHKLNDAINRVIQNRDFRERLEANAFDPVGGTQPQFAEYVKAEIAKWGKVMRETGAKPD